MTFLTRMLVSIGKEGLLFVGPSLTVLVGFVSCPEVLLCPAGQFIANMVFYTSSLMLKRYLETSCFFFFDEQESCQRQLFLLCHFYPFSNLL